MCMSFFCQTHKKSKQGAAMPPLHLWSYISASHAVFHFKIKPIAKELSLSSQGQMIK